MFEAAIRINAVKKYTRDEIFDKLKSILVEDFEILQGFTQKKISPENFKQIRTINDVVLAVEELL